jgi:hypothetical protein
MAAPYKLKTKFRGRVKPSVPVEIDWTNPITKGLYLFDIFNGHGNASVNLVKQQPFLHATNNISQAGFTRGADKYGKKLNSVKAQNDILELHPDRDIVSGNSYTALTGVKYTNATTDHSLMYIGSGSVNSINTILMWADTNAGSLRTGFNSSGSSNSANGTIPTDEFVVWGFNFTSGGPTSSEGYVNGNSVVTGSTGSTASMSNMPFYYANQNPGTRGVDGDIYFFAYWDRLLTDAEHKEFSDNPYGFLKPKIDNYYFVSSAASGTTYEDAITLAGQSNYTNVISSIDFGAALSFGGQSGFTATNLAIYENGLTFAGQSDYSAVAGFVFENSVTLAGQSDYTLTNLAVFESALSFAGQSDYTLTNLAVFESALSFAGQSTFTADGQFLWIEQADAVTSWADQSNSSTVWATQSDSSITWSNVADESTTWSVQSDESTTWTDQND